MRSNLCPLSIFFLACSTLGAAVAPSPFLPPGYHSRPKPSSTPKSSIKPKSQVPNVQISKEIDFCGYFSLGAGANRKLFFSLFNKKVNHGQWISLGEKTDEDFLAESFDFESETLTIRFGGSSHELTLRQAKGGSPVKPGTRPPSAPPVTASLSTPGKPRVMPPRPKTTPTLPPWLAYRVASGTSRAGGGIRGSSSRQVGSGSVSGNPPSTGLPMGYVPRRVSSPGSPTTGSSPSRVGPVSSNPITGRPISTPPSPAPEGPGNGGPTPSPSPVPDDESAGGGIDLNNLPPPPPPPDILPPGPPPNIIPSRED